jgi:Holliday junction DNA helicase RuvB
MIEQDNLQDSVLNPENTSNEDHNIISVRPKKLDEYIGQAEVKSQMSLFIRGC